MRLGLLAILIGVLYLLKNLDFITVSQWSILWPIIVIYLGIAMVARHRCWHCKVWHDGLHSGKMCAHKCDCEVCEEGAEK